MKVLRVFPYRTTATPEDGMVRIGYPGLFDKPVDEVHISVTFTWDLPEAEQLMKAWQGYGVVKIGGPGTGMPGNGFEVGQYIKKGYVITSRGCPNDCWFCKVHERETFQELDIKPGHIIQDDNLLACREAHIRAVFKMLGTQPKSKVELRGLEAKLLEPWHVELLRELDPYQVFFAYDTPDDYEPLLRASDILKSGGLVNFRKLRCYNLIGYEGDTIKDAENRLRLTVKAGFMPFAMLWHNDNGQTAGIEWRRFQRSWCRPAAIMSMVDRQD